MKRFPSLVELMDDPDCSEVRLNRTYHVFYWLNRFLGRWEAVFETFILPEAEPGKTLTVLDIGCGGGDVAERLLQLAKKNSVAIQITGIDPDRRAIAFAKKHRSPEIIFEQTGLQEIGAAKRKFDIVISNHVTHHVPDNALNGFLELSSQVCRKRVIHNDVRRSGFGLLLYPFIALIPGLFSFVLYDGLVSILRSRTLRELKQDLQSGWDVTALEPFRVLITKDVSG
jgi:SAM-dependent methyltransferase